MSASIGRSLGTAVGAINQVGAVVGGVRRLAGDVAGLLGVDLTRYQGLIAAAPANSWLAQLQPASWRGLPFAVEAEEVVRGRRVSVHSYPFRDQVWPEDIGRGARPFRISGFVLGDDCFAQAQALLDAAEVKGPGTLVHPWMGARTVALTGPMRAATRKDLGGVVEIAIEAVEYAGPIYPGASDDTQGKVTVAVGGANMAAASDFGGQVVTAVRQGSATVQAAVRTVTGFAAAATRLAGDAALVTHAVAGLTAPPGTTYGRYANGSRGTLLSGITTAEGAIGAVTRARSVVSRAASDVTQLAGLL